MTLSTAINVVLFYVDHETKDAAKPGTIGQITHDLALTILGAYKLNPADVAGLRRIQSAYNAAKDVGIE